MRIERGYVVVAAVTAGEGVVSFLVPPYLDSRQFPVGVIGVLVAAGALAALASRVPAGLIYRGGRARGLLVATMLLAALAAALIPAAGQPLAFAALRGLGGFCYGVATTVNLARYIDAIPLGRNRASAMGYFSSALAVGFMIGNGVGGFAGDVLGYPLAFSLGAVHYVVGAAVAATLPAPARATAPRRSVPAAGPVDWLSGLRMLTEPGIVRVAAAGFLLSFMQSISGTFFALYALSAGLALGEIGAIRTMTALVNAVTRGLGGWVTGSIGRARAQHLGLTLQGGGIMLLASFDGFWALFMLMFATATFRAVVLVANTIALTEDVDESRVSRGVASGIFNAANDLGHILAPVLGGAVASLFGLGAMFRLLPPLVLALYAAAMVATARRGAPVPGPSR